MRECWLLRLRGFEVLGFKGFRNDRLGMEGHWGLDVEGFYVTRRMVERLPQSQGLGFRT